MIGGHTEVVNLKRIESQSNPLFRTNSVFSALLTGQKSSVNEVKVVHLLPFLFLSKKSTLFPSHFENSFKPISKLQWSNNKILRLTAVSTTAHLTKTQSFPPTSLQKG